MLFTTAVDAINALVTAQSLHRLLYRARIVVIEGKSCRMKNRLIDGPAN